MSSETWVSFELAKAANVQIQIYDVSGRLVRRLGLDYRSAGYCVERSKAGYWDDAMASASASLVLYTYTGRQQENFSAV